MPFTRAAVGRARGGAGLLLVAVLAGAGGAQQRPAQAGLPEPKNWTAQEDHKQMMEQLGITALRPGPSGNEQDANHANYDESTANPFPKLPDVLTLKNGFMVVGESACASPANFDAELGKKIAHDNARNKIWALEGYALRNRLAAAE